MPGTSTSIEGIIMSSKLFPTVATVVIAVAGAVTMTSAFAADATQYNPEQGSKSRAEVKAEALAARTDATVVQYGEATVFVDRASTQSRALARAQAIEGPVHVVRVGDATEFVDQPGVRTRGEVRAETLAALRTGR
jgi:hypothetical protein